MTTFCSGSRKQPRAAMGNVRIRKSGRVTNGYGHCRECGQRLARRIDGRLRDHIA